MQKPNPSPLAALQAKLQEADPIRDQLPSAVQIYCVGGAVRDALIEQTSSDLDFVVVGASIDDMVAAGFMPVGKDFPVFLHPLSHDEYALARTERKSGKGYKGFVFNADPSVSLADDLARRDLTINAMALDRSGKLIDPHHGQEDLARKTLRHIGAAFTEDPVRLLRLARFAARWPQFSIAPETLALCHAIVASGEADALVPERVWQEISQGLAESKPSRMIEMLAQCQAWPRLHPQAATIHAQTLNALDRAAEQGLALECRYALLIHNQAGHAQQPADLFKANSECIELANLLCKQHALLPHALQSLRDTGRADPQALLHWLMACDITRKAARYQNLLAALSIEGAISHTEFDLLNRIATLLTSKEAGLRAAQAAQNAQASQQPVADAVAAARLAILQSALERLR